MNQQMRPDLAARFSAVRLPRYTSYPTAPHFNAAVDGFTYADWLGSVGAGVDASVYVHIPFCRRMCWYCGCNTAVTLRNEPILAYVEALRQEMALVGSLFGDRPSVSHLHFGGGTPNILPAAVFVELVVDLRSTFDLAPSAELAIEIDPRTMSPEMIAAFRAAGVTRASLGVQSLDPRVQKAIGREQNFEETAAVADQLRQIGVAVNLDLIYGLPYQTVSSCVETVERCLSIRPDRFAVFGYAHVPDFKKHQRKIKEAALPDGRERVAQSEAVTRTLQAAGYRRVGLDHFAHPTDTLAMAQVNGALHRNFQGYTTDNAELLIGLGASAIGRLPQGYVQNEPTIRAYLAAIADGRPATCKGLALSPEDRFRGDIIEQLMCNFRVDVEAICRRHHQPLHQLEGAFDALADLAADGVVRRSGSVIEMEPGQEDLVRVAAACFDAYLTASKRAHSQAV